ncbi:MAG: anthranilate synthase component I [Chitinispirillales bacterium]|jgi:anthranilate synthase component 1|nr:anthranilate synthase component I [Chitinispirillales bacterium]
MPYPSLEEIKSYRDVNVIPVYKTAIADTETPVSAWMKLCRDAPYSFLFESVPRDGSYARYSFIGANPYMIFSVRDKKWTITVGGERKDCGDGDPISALRKILATYKQAAVKDIPRFCGGAVGYFSYDAVRVIKNIPDKNPKTENDDDDIFFGFYRDLIVFDNKKHQLLFISNIILNDSNNNDRDDIDNQYKNALARIDAMEKTMETPIVSSRLSIKTSGEKSFNFGKEQFEAAVDKCKEYIKAGEISQVVLSRRGSVDVEADPFDLYRSLRIVNPSPYMFYLSLDERQIIGASPEMLVRVENNIVENRPIAGTRRRGETAAEDERLIEELKNDPKEINEHTMLLELGKNELREVCEPDSVKVDNAMRIEKYSHVIHIVSDLSGKLRGGRDALDALFACFPAGTLTGAPKVRAMEIIDELEPSRRGLYGGALGYIDFSGNMDTCITIRTIFLKNGKAQIQSGAGIVAESIPEREYQETVEKASALFAAIGAG